MEAFTDGIKISPIAVNNTQNLSNRYRILVPSRTVWDLATSMGYGPHQIYDITYRFWYLVCRTSGS